MQWLYKQKIETTAAVGGQGAEEVDPKPKKLKTKTLKPKT